jgi:hypothetical protein
MLPQLNYLFKGKFSDQSQDKRKKHEFVTAAHTSVFQTNNSALQSHDSPSKSGDYTSAAHARIAKARVSVSHSSASTPQAQE